MTKHGKRYAFVKELRALLKKYKVNITANDYWEGRPECGQDIKIAVEFDDWEMKDIDLGKNIWYDDPLKKLDKLKEMY